MSLCACGAELPENLGGRGRKRKWCSERCRRRTLYGGKCVDCGQLTSEMCNAHPPQRCLPCAQNHLVKTTHERPDIVAARARHLRMLERWAAGSSAKEIADEFGTTPGTVAGVLNRLRKYGYEVPPRRAGNSWRTRPADPRRLAA